jgi:hypothetical protein
MSTSGSPVGFMHESTTPQRHRPSMKIRFLLVVLPLVAIDAMAAECKPGTQSESSAECLRHDAARKAIGQNDQSASTQKSAGADSSNSNGSAGHASADEDEIDDVTGEACVVKSASGVCIDDGGE